MNKFYAVAALAVLLNLNSQAQVIPTEGIDNFPNQEVTLDEGSIAGEFPEADVLTNIQSVQSGDWNSPYTWDCMCIPSQGDGVRIMPDHTVGLNADALILNVVVAQGGSLQLSSAAPMYLRVYGHMEVLGGIASGFGGVEFYGLQAHYFWGNAQLAKLAVSNASLELYGNLEVADQLTLTNTTLITNGMLTLGSSGGEMAQINEVQNSDITGEVTFVQEFEWEEEGWIAVATPAADATFADWDNELTTTGFAGSDFPEMEANILSYDETQASEENSLTAPTDIDATIAPGAGYYVYGNAGTVEVKTTASPVIGMHVFGMTYTDNADPEFDGVNMLGNPYAATLNWDDNAWIRYGMDMALYVYDQENGQFRTYVDGLSINGGSPIIESGQAFVVRATESNCGLIAQEAVKTVTPAATLNQGNDILRLEMLNIFGGSDEMMVRMNENATEDFDLGMDAAKMMAENSHNIYTKGSASKMGINQLAKSAGMEIPIYVNVPMGGSFMLTLPQAPEDTEGGCMVIEDVLTGEMIPVAGGSTYAFTSDAVADQHRFSLHVAAPLEVEMEHVSCNGANDAFITVQGQGDGELTYHWFDQNDNAMLTYQVVGGASTVSGLGAGTYTIVVDGGTVCDGMTTQVQVHDPNPVEITATEIETLGCGESNTGSIAILAGGGTGPLDFQWTGGQTSPTISGLAAGFYHVFISDQNDCQIEQTFEVAGAVNVSADFEVAQAIIPLVDGEAQVDLINLSEGADIFLWNMGDGTFYEDETPLHVYTEPGVYDIDLEATNADNCFGMWSVSVEVIEEVVSVEEVEAFGSTKVWMNQEGVQVDFELDAAEDLAIRVYNQLGQVIAEQTIATRLHERTTLELADNVRWALVDVYNPSTGNARRFKAIR